jgi:hypothetical protein
MQPILHTSKKKRKIDNDFLNDHPALRKQLRDADIRQDDVDRISTTATHLKYDLLAKSVTVWTCPYWSHRMQHPEYHYIQTIDAAKKRDRQDDDTYTHYKRCYDDACRHLLGIPKEVEDTIKETIDYVTAICKLTDVWDKECVTIPPYIKMVKKHVLCLESLTPEEMKTSKKYNNKIDLLSLFMISIQLAHLLRQHHQNVLKRSGQMGSGSRKRRSTAADSDTPTNTPTQIYQISQIVAGMTIFLVRSWLYVYNHRATKEIQQEYKDLLDRLGVSAEECDTVCIPNRYCKTLCKCDFNGINRDLNDIRLTCQYQDRLVKYLDNISKGTKHDIPRYLREIKTTHGLEINMIQADNGGKKRTKEVVCRSRKRSDNGLNGTRKKKSTLKREK